MCDTSGSIQLSEEQKSALAFLNRGQASSGNAGNNRWGAASVVIWWQAAQLSEVLSSDPYMYCFWDVCWAKQKRLRSGGGEAEPAPICFHYFFKFSLGCCFTKGAVLMLVLNCTSITNPVHCGESRGGSRSSAVPTVFILQRAPRLLGAIVSLK